MSNLDLNSFAYQNSRPVVPAPAHGAEKPFFKMGDNPKLVGRLALGALALLTVVGGSLGAKTLWFDPTTGPSNGGSGSSGGGGSVGDGQLNQYNPYSNPCYSMDGLPTICQNTFLSFIQQNNSQILPSIAQGNSQATLPPPITEPKKADTLNPTPPPTPKPKTPDNSTSTTSTSKPKAADKSNSAPVSSSISEPKNDSSKPTLPISKPTTSNNPKPISPRNSVSDYNHCYIPSEYLGTIYVDPVFPLLLHGITEQVLPPTTQGNSQPTPPTPEPKTQENSNPTSTSAPAPKTTNTTNAEVRSITKTNSQINQADEMSQLTSPDKNIGKLLKKKLLEKNFEGVTKDELKQMFSILPRSLASDIARVHLYNRQIAGNENVLGIPDNEKIQGISSVGFEVLAQLGNEYCEQIADATCETRHPMRLYTREMTSEEAEKDAQHIDWVRHNNVDGKTCQKLKADYNNCTKLIEKSGAPNEEVTLFAKAMSYLQYPVLRPLRYAIIDTWLCFGDGKTCKKPSVLLNTFGTVVGSVGMVGKVGKAILYKNFRSSNAM